MKDGFPFDGAAPLGLRGKTEDTHFKPKLKLELERQLELDFCFSGSAAEGAALLSPPTPTPEGSGVWGNRLLIVSYW